MKECEICFREFKGRDYQLDDMLVCEDCFNDAINKADILGELNSEQEDYLLEEAREREKS